METKKKLWLPVVVLLAAALLSIWGMERVWTAAELLPEQSSKLVSVSKTSAAVKEREETETLTTDAIPELEEETATRYAVGRHKRNKTLADPFRAQVIASPVPVSGSNAPTQAAVSSVPRLCGIVIAGEDRRAILEDGGTTQTWREGEGTAGWTVTEIRETNVRVTGSFGTQILTL